MKDLFLLVKYGSKGSSLVLGKKGKIFSSIFPLLLAILVFGLPIYYTQYITFSRPMPKEVFHLVGGLWSLMMSLLTLTSLIPGILYSVTGSEDRELLSYLPIDGATLRWYFTLISLVTNPMLPVAYVMGLMGTFRGRGMSIWLGLANGLSQLIFLTGLASVVAFLLSWRIWATRRLYMYSFIVDVILLVLVIQINPATAGNPLGMARKLLSMRWLLVSNFSPFYWPISNRPCEIVALGAITLLLASFIPVGEPEVRLSEKKSRFLGKEIALFLRKEQNAFFLAYPLIFSILYGYFFKSDLQMYLIHVTFAAFYSSVSSGALVQEELLIYPLSRVLPIIPVKLMLGKILVTLVAYSMTAVVVVVFGLVNGFKLVDTSYILSFPVTVLLSTSYGALEAMRNPEFSRGRVLNGKGLLRVEATGVGFALISFGIPGGLLDAIYEFSYPVKVMVLLASPLVGILLAIRFIRNATGEFQSFEF